MSAFFHEIEFDKKQYIIRENHPVEYLYYLTSGSVLVEKNNYLVRKMQENQHSSRILLNWA